MTDYPPSRTVTLGSALSAAEQRVDELKPDDEDDEPDAEIVPARNERDALQWAVGRWGEGAEITLEAYTARTRARVTDTLRQEMVGEPGPSEQDIWLIAAGLSDAPWIDDHDLASKAAATGQLPPALVDWLNGQVDDINDLSEGN